MVEILVPACPGHCADSGVGKPPPPMVTSVRHVGAMAVSEQDVLVHRTMQEGDGAE